MTKYHLLSQLFTTFHNLSQHIPSNDELVDIVKKFSRTELFQLSLLFSFSVAHFTRAQVGEGHSARRGRGCGVCLHVNTAVSDTRLSQLPVGLK